MLGALSTHPLRGDYSRAAADYTVQQDMSLYTEVDQQVWRQLITRQPAVVQKLAAREFLAGLEQLELTDSIPEFERISDQLQRQTGWRIVPVPGFVPDAVFFAHLAARRFPVSVWVRKPEELDYLVEPDMFHDIFGHVPLLSNPVFAEYLAEYGRKGQATTDPSDLRRLSRLYWYMVEFGLIQTDEGLRAYGAGMLSSKTETIYSVESPVPHRLWFDLERVMRTTYLIDDFQKTYFVLRDFDSLFRAMDQDFAQLYQRLALLTEIDPATCVAGDALYSASG